MTYTLSFEDGIDDALRRRVRETLDALDIPEVRGPVDVRVLDGGAMNQNFVLRTLSTDLVLRISGVEVDRFGVNRAQGLAAHQEWQTAGISPRLYAATLPSGDCVSQFLNARTLDRAILQEPGTVEACVRALNVAHHTSTVGGAWSIFDDIDRYRTLAEEERLALPEDFSRFVVACDAIELSLSTAEIPDVMAHNDLQLQNYLLADDGAWIIDLEYAAPASPYLDLGMLYGYGELNPAQRDSLLETYFGFVRETDQHRLELMHFAAALREAIWSVCAQPTLGEATGWSYADWALRFFEKARAVVSDPGFDDRVARAGRAHDDDRAFENAARIAEANAGMFRTRAMGGELSSAISTGAIR